MRCRPGARRSQDWLGVREQLRTALDELEFPFAPLLLLSRPAQGLRLDPVIGEVSQVHAVVPVQRMGGPPGLQPCGRRQLGAAEVNVQISQ